MNDPQHLPSAASFATTRWSRVLLARGGPSPEADAALAELCRAYWYPLYAYIRRRCGGAAEAEDLTQGLFAGLLEGDFLGAVTPAKGRFRAFLLACCNHYLANQRDRAGAARRGGGRAPLPLDFAAAEGRYRREPAAAQTPERLFDRGWALALLGQALERVGDEYRAAGKGALFDRLKETLPGSAAPPAHADLGRELGLGEAAVRKAAQRLRQRYRDALRGLVAETVAGPEEVDDEIRDLFAALTA